MANGQLVAIGLSSGLEGIKLSSAIKRGILGIFKNRPNCG